MKRKKHNGLIPKAKTFIVSMLILFLTFGCTKETHVLTLTVSPAEAGIVEEGGKFESGETVNLLATANAGFQFAVWAEETDMVSLESGFTYNMPDRDVILTAYFFIPGNGVTDIDGNNYPTVIIGQQEWMAENLRVTRFNDGTPIPHLTESSDWLQLTTPAYCWYNNDEAGHKIPYGALYSWFVTDAQNNGGKNVCPEGWHVPSDAEWSQMLLYLDPNSNPNNLQESLNAGGKLKEAGFQHWDSPNAGATNATGFFGRPGGYRDQGTNFVQMGQLSRWWTADEHKDHASSAWWRSIESGSPRVARHYLLKRQANSIRCIKD